MDKYHIYEEIGKGSFSQVFKGREKRKIEYVSALHALCTPSAPPLRRAWDVTGMWHAGMV